MKERTAPPPLHSHTHTHTHSHVRMYVPAGAAPHHAYAYPPKHLGLNVIRNMLSLSNLKCTRNQSQTWRGFPCPWELGQHTEHILLQDWAQVFADVKTNDDKCCKARVWPCPLHWAFPPKHLCCMMARLIDTGRYFTDYPGRRTQCSCV